MAASVTDDGLHAEAKERFEERAAIIEFDGRLPKPDAERRAKVEVANWLKSKRREVED